jgi:hypothetical protein
MVINNNLNIDNLVEPSHIIGVHVLQDGLIGGVIAVACNVYLNNLWGFLVNLVWVVSVQERTSIQKRTSIQEKTSIAMVTITDLFSRMGALLEKDKLEVDFLRIGFFYFS